MNTCQQNNGPDDLMWSRTTMDLDGICRAGVIACITLYTGARREISGPGAKISFGLFGQWCSKLT